MIKKETAAGVLLGILLGVLTILLLAVPGHCSVPQRSNNLGAVISDTNPNTYLYASIIDGAVIGNEKKEFTVIRFQPAHTFELYDESVLFCGNRAEDFRSMMGPIVVTYTTVAHTAYQGVGCHDLIDVEKVASKGKVK